MNERIKLLKQQAGIDDNPDQEGLDLFAELIVRECMEVVSKKCASPTAYNALVEHFGVK
jgi:hypothetical protein